MDKTQILETAFEAIKDSTEWGIECKDQTYGHWVDGVVTVVDNLLNKISEENNGRTIEN